MALTSRERLQLTLEHKDPGKVVVDLGSNSVTGINANALARLRTKLGLEEHPVKINEPLQLLGEVEEDVRPGAACIGVLISNSILRQFCRAWCCSVVKSSQEPPAIRDGGGFNAFCNGVRFRGRLQWR